MSPTSHRGRERTGHPAEPELVTAPGLLPVLEALRRREPIFHRPEFGSRRADFERMVEADFWEVGASGRRYSRAFILDQLERNPPLDAAAAGWRARTCNSAPSSSTCSTS